MAFIRQLMQRGDPFGVLASTGFPVRRKQAGGGTMQKAARHRAIRMQRLVGDPMLGLAIGKGLVKAPTKGFQMPDFGKMGKDAFSKMMPFLGGASKFAKGVLGSGALGPVGALVGSVLPGGAPNTRPSTSFGPLPGMPSELAGFLPGAEERASKSSNGENGKRRRMNPLNVRALRRGLNRVRSFQGIVNRVNQLLPAGARRKAGGTFPKRRRRK